MAVLNPLVPDDPRLTQHNATLFTGRTYHYFVLPPPADAPLRGTIVLMHGFPDLPMGWRCVAPRIAQLGVRVVMPTMLGYPGTDAPTDVEEYTYRSIAADMAALARHVVTAEEVIGGAVVGGEEAAATPPPPPAELPVLLGGHDWGGAIAWATARLYPDVFASVFSVCVPYSPPSKAEIPFDVVAAAFPTMGYMKQFGSAEFAAKVNKSERTIRNFLAALFSKGEHFDPRKGVDEVVIVDEDGPAPKAASTLMNDEMFDYYVREHARDGMEERLNYYRNHGANYKAGLVEATAEGGPAKIRIPSLFVVAEKDAVVTREMAAAGSQREGRFVDGVEFGVKRLAGGHWVLVDQNTAEEAGDVLCEWVRKGLDKAEGDRKRWKTAATAAAL
jgi:pimeloyl-ACP methyl ester carboxylesterase